MTKPAISVSFPYLNAAPAWLKCNRTGDAWGLSSGVLKQFAANTPRLCVGLGLLIEGGSSNKITYSRDLTNAAWTKTNASAALNAIGLDAQSNTATTITASAANAVVKQTYTASSAAYTISAYLKLKPGATNPGNVYMSLDETTWYYCGPLSDTEWQRFSFTATLANPKIAIKISDNSGVLQVDCCQVETGSLATSPIVTTSSALARNADEVYIDINQTARTNWFNATGGAFVCNLLTKKVTGAQTFIYVRNQAATGNYMQLGSDFSTTKGYWENGYSKTKYYQISDNNIDATAISELDIKIATSYVNGLQLFSINGFRCIVPANDETNTIDFSTVDAIWLGNKDTTNYMSGIIRSLLYYDKPLNQNELNQLTV